MSYQKRKRRFWKIVKDEIRDDILAVRDIFRSHGEELEILPMDIIIELFISEEEVTPYQRACISKNVNLTIEMILSGIFRDWNWRFISSHENITPKIVEENIDLPWEIGGLSRNPSFYWEDLVKINTLLPGEIIKDINLLAMLFSYNPNFRPSLVKKYPDLNWKYSGIADEWKDVWTYEKILELPYHQRARIRPLAADCVHKKLKHFSYWFWPIFIPMDYFFPPWNIAWGSVMLEMDLAITWEIARSSFDGDWGVPNIDIKRYCRWNINMTPELFIEYEDVYHLDILDFIQNPNCTLEFLDKHYSFLKGICGHRLFTRSDTTFKDILRYPEWFRSGHIYNYLTRKKYDASLDKIVDYHGRRHMAAYLIQWRWRKVANDENHPVGKSVIGKKLRNDLYGEELADVSFSYM